MYAVDLNSDLGESFGPWKMGHDSEVMKYITSANIACGAHGGDPSVMEETVAMAVEKSVAIGAHPGYPDLQGFGRRDISYSPEEVYCLCLYQIGALQAFCRAHGTEIRHVKAHGAMYNYAAKNITMARAIARAVGICGENIILTGLAGSLFEKAASEEGVRFASEAFADRAYSPDGSLVPRKEQGAVIHDPHYAAERVVRMVRHGSLETFDGSEIKIKADTICLHGDTAEAVEMASIIRNRLEKEGIRIASLREVI